MTQRASYSDTTILPAPSVAGADWLKAARRAVSWLSLVWMGAEGTIAIVAGVIAGSIALVGFGIDSAIEGVASLVIIWRFTGQRLLSHAAEQRAPKLVAVQFFLLAPYVAFEAVQHLITGHHPEISVLGMVLTATSLVGMPMLGPPNSDSPTSSAPRPPTAKEPKTCSAPTRRGRLPRSGRERPLRLVVARPDRRASHRRGHGK
jgi:hypothetical protein